jgi:hypothetical protein
MLCIQRYIHNAINQCTGYNPTKKEKRENCAHEPRKPNALHAKRESSVDEWTANLGLESKTLSSRSFQLES